ncbi:hypothetical protein MSP8886_01809 [Marinomonas spartinae]|uniref:Phage Tail Collar Domain protein n=1 Tax=Marinomonas spartinae TaxID=1792290 RepID=A0A1A8TCF9_9GAMM|nr:hypothetical protein [Marinomonas spartinae]SBS30426.1 hypothetical protein MSP8886_01809 [Marinomonas spartinae]
MNYPDSNDLYNGKFTDGDPLNAIPASIASADHMNAIYDELKALITAGGLAPDFNDLAQVSQSVGSQLRSKRLFDVSGTANAILLTTPAGKQPVTTLNNYDEFSFIVAATNTASGMTIKIDELAVMPLAGPVATQIFETALLTVRYINGVFYVADQVNPQTGVRVSDIAKLYIDTVDVLGVGEYALDGAQFSSRNHPLGWAIVSASSNCIDQATKDSDPITYGGYWGFVAELDGSFTVTLPMIGGEFIRMFDDGRGVDVGREFGSWQADEFKSHTHNFSLASNNRLGNTSGNARVEQPIDNNAPTSFTGGNETRPRSIAYYGKTRL